MSGAGRRATASASPRSEGAGLAAILQMPERPGGFMRFERHGDEPGLDALANTDRLGKVLRGPKAFCRIPIANLPEEGDAEIEIGTDRAEEGRNGLERAVLLQRGVQRPIEHASHFRGGSPLLPRRHMGPPVSKELCQVIVV